MLSQQQLAKLKARLEEEKRDLEARMERNDNLGLKAGHYHEASGELSSYDNHPADEGTELFERQKDIALFEHYRRELDDIEKALTSIEKGTYGKCEVCGKDIDPERLEALPTTTFCKEHSPDKMVSRGRPLEEGVLMPPFGKFDMDETDESTVFDAEDSWQEVQSWGTSETPSDFAEPHGGYHNLYNESDEGQDFPEAYESFAGVDLYGNDVTVYPTKVHEEIEEALDEEGIMTPFGDLPAFEHDPYTEDQIFDIPERKKDND